MPRATEKLYSAPTALPASSSKLTPNKTYQVAPEALPSTKPQFLDAATPLKSAGGVPTTAPRVVPAFSSPVTMLPTTLVFTTKMPNLTEMSQNSSAQVKQVMRGKETNLLIFL